MFLKSFHRAEQNTWRTYTNTRETLHHKVENSAVLSLPTPFSYSKHWYESKNPPPRKVTVFLHCKVGDNGISNCSSLSIYYQDRKENKVFVTQIGKRFEHCWITISFPPWIRLYYRTSWLYINEMVKIYIHCSNLFQLRWYGKSYRNVYIQYHLTYQANVQINFNVPTRNPEVAPCYFISVTISDAFSWFSNVITHNTYLLFNWHSLTRNRRCSKNVCPYVTTRTSRYISPFIHVYPKLFLEWTLHTISRFPICYRCGNKIRFFFVNCITNITEINNRYNTTKTKSCIRRL